MKRFVGFLILVMVVAGCQAPSSTESPDIAGTVESSVSATLTSEAATVQNSPTETLDKTRVATAITNAGNETLLTAPAGPTVHIPADALPDQTEVVLRRLAEDDAPALSQEYVAAGPIFDINLGATTLAQPALLVIPFDTTQLSADVAPENLFLATYDVDTQAWRYAGGEVDVEAGVIRLEIEHASLWTILGWNWNAWPAALDLLLRVGFFDSLKALELLTESCSQRVANAYVLSASSHNLLQGCISETAPPNWEFRVVNPRPFFVDIYASESPNLSFAYEGLLGPGDNVRYEVSAGEKPPATINVYMSERAARHLILQLTIRMLPGASQVNLPPEQLTCITNRISELSHIASIGNKLLFERDYLGASEAYGRFLMDNKALERFVGAAAWCGYDPAKTWSIEGISILGRASSTTLSILNLVGTAFGQGITEGEVTFEWTRDVDPTLTAVAMTVVASTPTATPQPPPTPTPTIARIEGSRVLLGERVLLEIEIDAPGCFEPGEISYSPTGEHFLVVLDCFEGDNDAFLFDKDGTNRRRITAIWDYINYRNYRWEPDGSALIYQRINSCCADPPPNAPPEGEVRYDIATGAKVVLDLSFDDAPYMVVGVAADDVLNVRSGPGVDNGIVGTIPYSAINVAIVGEGVTVGDSTWVPIQYEFLSGWINLRYLAPRVGGRTP